MNPTGSGVPVVRVLLQRHLTAEKPCDMLVLPERWAAGLLGDLTSTPTSAVDMALIVGRSLLSPENQVLQCFTLLRAHLKRGFAEITIRRARSSPDSIGVPSLQKIDSISPRFLLFTMLPSLLPSHMES